MSNNPSPFFFSGPYREKNGAEALNSLRHILTKYATIAEFTLAPDLRSGTFDTLNILVDDMVKIDTQIEALGRRLARQITDLVGARIKTVDDDTAANLKQTLSSIFVIGRNTPMKDYPTHFQWDTSRYPLHTHLRAMVAMITHGITRYDNALKSLTLDYNSFRQQLSIISRKYDANLLTKPLNGVILREHLVPESVFMEQLFLVVPKGKLASFSESYLGSADPEGMADSDTWSAPNTVEPFDSEMVPGVVPGSLTELSKDDDYTLFSLIVLKKKLALFKKSCRENQWVIRDFVYDEHELERIDAEKSELADAEQAAFDTLLGWAKESLPEIFKSYIHIKVLRLHVESLLRFGDKKNFFTCIIHPKDKQFKKTKEKLIDTYSGFDDSPGQSTYASTSTVNQKSKKKKSKQKTEIIDVAGANPALLSILSNTEVLPYIQIPFTTDWDARI